ncbi:Riboflavin synthase alpha chain [Agyrium rufum]|nr:Riboflavin synthase alpha chain [Agyrium rufum]
MFTGIVETIGTISTIEHQDPEAAESGIIFTISECPDILGDAHKGDSISVNGTCLTITTFTSTSFTVTLSPETLRRTNLGRLNESSRVNLERAVSASTRMGGHFVQGHVDTIATIAKTTPDGNAIVYRLQPRDIGVLRYIVEKGYVTLDGASLTVTAVSEGAETVAGNGDGGGEEWFEVMLIPYTREKVVMGDKSVGEEVNIEVDMVGKYVENSVKGYFEQGSKGEDGMMPILERMVDRMVVEKLREIGLHK